MRPSHLVRARRRTAMLLLAAAALLAFGGCSYSRILRNRLPTPHRVDDFEHAVRFVYEWHDDSGHWYRSYGNENWEFNDQGFMQRRFASINDLPIAQAERKFHWPLGRRPDDHPGLSELGL